MYDKDFSVIIPHRNSVQHIPKLLSTIPDSDRIEIIIVDNSLQPITKADIGVDRNYHLLYSSPNRGAGGARNVGIDNANGKWLLFLDADDYLTEEAFDVFYSKYDTDADIVYSCMTGIYLDTGKYADRVEKYAKLVTDYINNDICENDLKYRFLPPWGKMINHDLVKEHHIKFDEIIASNDIQFSLLCGYYATKIDAIDKITFIITVSKGSLTQRRDYDVIFSRFCAYLKFNRFLKQHNLSNYQMSVTYFLISSYRFGCRKLLLFSKKMIEYRQNPFIGYRNWGSTFLSLLFRKEKKYKTY